MALTSEERSLLLAVSILEAFAPPTNDPEEYAKQVVEAMGILRDEPEVVLISVALALGVIASRGMFSLREILEPGSGSDWILSYVVEAFRSVETG